MGERMRKATHTKLANNSVKSSSIVFVASMSSYVQVLAAAVYNQRLTTFYSSAWTPFDPFLRICVLPCPCLCRSLHVPSYLLPEGHPRVRL